MVVFSLILMVCVSYVYSYSVYVMYFISFFTIDGLNKIHKRILHIKINVSQYLK